MLALKIWKKRIYMNIECWPTEIFVEKNVDGKKQHGANERSGPRVAQFTEWCDIQAGDSSPGA